VRLALISATGEMGYPAALTRAVGLLRRALQGQAVPFQRAYGSYVMENVLFKISYPAEFHAQTAVEAAMALHEQLKAWARLDDIEKIVIRTHEAACASSTRRAARNPADRDHCCNTWSRAADLRPPDGEGLRGRRRRRSPHRSLAREDTCVEDRQFTPTITIPTSARSPTASACAQDGTTSPKIVVEYPIGHKRRRAEGIPLLVQKFRTNLARRFARTAARDSRCSLDQSARDTMQSHDATSTSTPL
jgi:2-methylcitrate dehydratase